MTKIDKKQVTAYNDDDVEQGGHSPTASGGENLYSHYANQYGVFPGI